MMSTEPQATKPYPTPETFNDFRKSIAKALAAIGLPTMGSRARLGRLEPWGFIWLTWVAKPTGHFWDETRKEIRRAFLDDMWDSGLTRNDRNELSWALLAELRGRKYGDRRRS